MTPLLNSSSNVLDFLKTTCQIAQSAQHVFQLELLKRSIDSGKDNLLKSHLNLMQFLCSLQSFLYHQHLQLEGMSSLPPANHCQKSFVVRTVSLFDALFSQTEHSVPKGSDLVKQPDSCQQGGVSVVRTVSLFEALCGSDVRLKPGECVASKVERSGVDSSTVKHLPTNHASLKTNVVLEAVQRIESRSKVVTVASKSVKGTKPLKQCDNVLNPAAPDFFPMGFCDSSLTYPFAGRHVGDAVAQTDTPMTISSCAQTEEAVLNKTFSSVSTQIICDRSCRCGTHDADSQADVQAVVHAQRVTMNAAWTQTVISDFEELPDSCLELHGLSCSQSSSECLEAEYRAYDELELCFEKFRQGNFSQRAVDDVHVFVENEDHPVGSLVAQTSHLDVPEVEDSEFYQFGLNKPDKPTEPWCIPVPCDEFDDDFTSIHVKESKNKDAYGKVQQITSFCSFSTLLEICTSASTNQQVFATLGSLSRFHKHLVVTGGTLADYCFSRSIFSRTVCLKFDEVTNSSSFCCITCHSQHHSLVSAECCSCLDDVHGRDKEPNVAPPDFGSCLQPLQHLDDRPANLLRREFNCVIKDELRGIISDPGTRCSNTAPRLGSSCRWTFLDNVSLRFLSIVDRFAFCQTQATLRARRLRCGDNKGTVLSLEGYVELVSCDSDALYRCALCKAWFQSFAPCFVCNCLMCNTCDLPSFVHTDFGLTCSCEQSSQT